MGLFDFFKSKKEEPHYDPTNISIRDLQKGFIFEYDLKTWVVNEVYEYDWGDNYFSREFKIDSGEEVSYLHMEEDDELELSITQKVKVLTIDENLPEYINDHQKPPKTLTYKGIKFYLDSENPGYFRSISDESKDWIEMISWEYYDEEDKHLISIEQWGEREFDAAYGVTVEEYEFSNILPAEKNT